MSRPLDNDTILSFLQACVDGEVRTVQSMINANGEEILRSLNGYGCTPLHHACMSSNPSLDIVQLLVNIGGEAMVTAADRDGSTTLHYACRSSNPSLDIVQFLVNIGGEAMVTAADGDGCTPLHDACNSSNPSLDIVQLLVSIGGEATGYAADDEYGKTPLHYACESSNPSFDIVQLLVSIGGEAMVTAADWRGWTPLHYACIRNNPSLDIVQLLVNIGGEAMVTAADEDGRTPLYYACMSFNPSFPVIELLLETGGCSNWDEIATLMMQREATFQETPILHLAIATGAPPNVLRGFIDRFDSCIGVADSNGRYPFHNAIEAGLSWENGIQKIVEHVGEAGIIGNTDPVTGLFPFMLAAAGDAHDLSSVYELLRMDTNCCVAQTISYL